MAASDIHDFARDLGKLILSIHKKASSLRLGFLREDLTFSQFFLMELLFLGNTLKMKDIAAEMNSSMPAATAIVDRMVRMGLVRRQRDDKDRRIVKITLTGEGKKMINAILLRREKMILEIFGKLTGKERGSYLRILSRIDQIMEMPDDKK